MERESVCRHGILDRTFEGLRVMIIFIHGRRDILSGRLAALFALARPGVRMRSVGGLSHNSLRISEAIWGRAMRDLSLFPAEATI